MVAKDGGTEAETQRDPSHMKDGREAGPIMGQREAETW